MKKAWVSIQSQCNKKLKNNFNETETSLDPAFEDKNIRRIPSSSKTTEFVRSPGTHPSNKKRKNFAVYLRYHRKLIFNTSFYDACLILVVGRNTCSTNNLNKGKAGETDGFLVKMGISLFTISSLNSNAMEKKFPKI